MKQKKQFNVHGMTCSACVAHVNSSLSKLESIHDVNVHLLSNSMEVEFDDQKITETEICNITTKAGYPTTIKGVEKASDKNVEFEDGHHQMKFRLWVSFGFLIPLMYISMGPMMGVPIFDIFVGPKNAIINAFTQLLLCLPILFVNRNYFIVGLKKLLILKPNMDSLIAVGSGASFLYGVIAIYMITYGQNYGNEHLIHQYMHDIYFESAATILTLITLGKYFESRSKNKTTEAISKLMDLTAKTAIRLVDDQEEEVEIDKIVVGDIIVLKSGSKAPVDGVVVKGYSSVDESALTGESIPVEKNVGDKVLSASTNGNGILLIEATKVGEDSTIYQIIKLVEEAGNSKAPISKLADKVSGIFVPIVIMISLLSFMYWYFIAGHDLSFSLSIAVAVLVISCPCALGLATPVAIMVGTGVGASNGILIKSGESLETLHHIDTIVLDKTGTITAGKPEVIDVINSEAFSLEEFLQKAYSIERFSQHQLASAINTYAKNKNIFALEVIDFQTLPGKGVIGWIDQKRILAGNIRLLEEYDIHDDWIKELAIKLSNEGKTPLLFCQEQSVMGVIAVGDTIKPTSKEAIALLKKMNLDVVMLTGDNQRTANAIAKNVEVSHVIADVLPSDKESVVRNYQSQGKKVAMVGDGINDAPALVRSDVGIAIGAGMDIAIDSADMILMKSDLLDVVSAVRLSKKVIGNIKGNLFWAFFYNTIGIPVAAGLFYSLLGFKLNPMIAAAAMSLSSVCVVTNALRLKSFKALHSKNQIIEKKEEKIMEKTIVIEGMTCGHCSGRVRDALNGIEGISAEVSHENNLAQVKLEKDISDEVLTQTITNAGYVVKSISNESK